MPATNDNNPSQRFTAYRTVIPFYILYDIDLNANHLRFYGQIEQMESNPDPDVNPIFSFAWMAKQLGIARRNAIEVAKKLKEKGYIQHIEIEPGKWVWTTVRKHISDATSDAEHHQGSDAQRHPGSDAQRHPKIPKDKIPKDKDIGEQDSPVSSASSKPSKPLEMMLANNPHKITIQVLQDWLEVRRTKRAPITETAWKGLIKELDRCLKHGLQPQYCFEAMVTSGWQSLKMEWIVDETKPRNGKTQSKKINPTL